jgi:NAD(P)-dependent dehydrogenase (short-subunit alcohol dehydrogenase family)
VSALVLLQQPKRLAAVKADSTRHTPASRGPYLCAKHVVEQAMKKSGKGGAIVNIASTRCSSSS